MNLESNGVARIGDQSSDHSNAGDPAFAASVRRLAERLAHHVRTPLTVIREFASILREGLGGPVTDRQRQYLAAIMARVDELALGVDDLLDDCALDAGRLNLWRQKVQPSALIEQARQALELRSVARQISLEIALDEPLPEVYCDAEKMVRAIVNLAAHVLKQQSDGGRVRLWAAACAEGHEVRLGIAGVASAAGLDEAHLGDAGLGLHVAREIVRANLGVTQAHGQAGGAGSYTLTLPAAEPRAIFARYLALVQADGGETPARGSFLSLLSAEIEPDSDARLRSAADGFLQSIVGGGELAYRLDERRWLIVVRRPQSELEELPPRIERAWTKFGEKSRPEGSAALKLNSLGSWRAERESKALAAAFAAEVVKFASGQGFQHDRENYLPGNSQTGADAVQRPAT